MLLRNDVSFGNDVFPFGERYGTLLPLGQKGIFYCMGLVKNY
jgi:hypothetical protein